MEENSWNHVSQKRKIWQKINLTRLSVSKSNKGLFFNGAFQKASRKKNTSVIFFQIRNYMLDAVVHLENCFLIFSTIKRKTDGRTGKRDYQTLFSGRKVIFDSILPYFSHNIMIPNSLWLKEMKMLLLP